MRGELISPRACASVALLVAGPIGTWPGLRRTVATQSRRRAHAAGCTCSRVEKSLVSGGFTFFTERLQTRLNLTQHANVLEIVDGKTHRQVASEILDAQAKKTG